MLAMKCVVALLLFSLVAFAAPWPTALGSGMGCAAMLIVFYVTYDRISRVEETEICLESGTIIQRRTFSILFPEKQYSLSDYGLIKSSLVGRTANWISIVLSGARGDLEVARFDPETTDAHWDSPSARELRELLVNRLKLRDLGFV